VPVTAPFSLNGTLTIPSDLGQPNVALLFAASGQFTSKEETVLNLTGSGTKTVSFGSIPGAGAKVVLIKVDAATGLQPVLVKINSSSSGEIEIAPGGFAVICNPTPSAGVTAIDILYTSANTVRVTLLGD
jgi:hypothetical protein